MKLRFSNSLPKIGIEEICLKFAGFFVTVFVYGNFLNNFQDFLKSRATFEKTLPTIRRG